MDKISVIVPIYNVERYLRQCLDSIVNQTYQNLEIILIDDGSPDNSGAICDEYARNDNRIFVIHKENQGVRAARNDGIAKATGEWIAFVDSDDWCELDFYEQMLQGNDCSDVDVIISGGHIKEYSHRSKIVRTFRKPCSFEGAEVQRQVMTYISKFGSPWDKLYRSVFLKQNQITFDVTCKAFDDYYFNLQVFCKAKSVAGNAAVCYHYRQVGSSIAHGFNPEKQNINYDFLCKANSYVCRQGMKEFMAVPVSAVGINAIYVALTCYYFHPANKKSGREIAREIGEMKRWRYYHNAIYNDNNQYLTNKQIVLKYALRIPWVWPVRLLCCGKEILAR